MSVLPRRYGIPCVSCMELRLGGLTYTGIPFTGWHVFSRLRTS